MIPVLYKTAKIQFYNFRSKTIEPTKILKDYTYNFQNIVDTIINKRMHVSITSKLQLEKFDARIQMFSGIKKFCSYAFINGECINFRMHFRSVMRFPLKSISCTIKVQLAIFHSCIKFYRYMYIAPANDTFQLREKKSNVMRKFLNLINFKRNSTKKSVIIH